MRARLPFSPWHLVLFPTAVLFALPLIWMILSSFMSNAQINQFPPTIIPDSLHLDGWNTVLGDSNFPRWFMNSTIVAAVTVVSNLAFCSLAGYAFARHALPRLDRDVPADPADADHPVPAHDDPHVHRHGQARDRRHAFGADRPRRWCCRSGSS